MSSHYRRVTAKRERMERDRSRSHSRTHSNARLLAELEEEDCVETHIERQVGSDGEEYVPAPTAVYVHIAVDVQVEHHSTDELDADQLSRALSATMLDPAPGVAWRDPFADPTFGEPPSDLISIAETEDFSPFVAYAPASAPPGLPSRKSSVCFAGVGPAGRIWSTRSRAQSDTRPCEGSTHDLSEKPLPSTPEDAAAGESNVVPEPTAESSESPAAAPASLASLPSPGISLDLPSPMPSFDLAPEPATPTSSTAASPCTPSQNQQLDFDPQATPSRSATSHFPSLGDTPKRSTARPGTAPQRRVPRRLQTLDSLPRAKIFSMVVDPEFDVFTGEADLASLKRVDTAPELNTGRSAFVQYATMDAATSSELKHRQPRTRARATSTPRRPNLAVRQRTSSTPSPPGVLVPQKASRRARMHAPPPTPPVSPAQVSSPRPSIGQDPGSWQSFGAAFESWGDTQPAPENGDPLGAEEYAMGLHRRQESAESSGSSATDISWSSSIGAPPSGSSVCSWP
ncbi:hypothetical protein RSAG8_00190, partial [Rhizoctonia solani AG-8 WAC10335]